MAQNRFSARAEVAEVMLVLVQVQEYRLRRRRAHYSAPRQTVKDVSKVLLDYFRVLPN